MHALIVGARGVGKSTLIRRVTAALGCPLWGFETKKETALADGEKGSPVYIYPVGQPHLQTPENLVGYCKDRHAAPLCEGFERCVPRLSTPVPEGSVVVLDEIGFLESSAPAFCRGVMALLEGDAPVLAAMKDKDTPFLQAVRSHPNGRCFYITEENRESLYAEVLAFMKEQCVRR